MKAIRIFLFILIVIGLVLLFTQKFWVPGLVSYILGSESTHVENEVPSRQTEKTVPPVSITSQNIKEDNFSGKMPTISGSSPVVSNAKNYIKNTIDKFREQANTDVPDLREKFGRDNPTTNYEIDIDAKYIKGEETESIEMSVYTYTGGAHGSTVYKVITADKSIGKILLLSDVVKTEEQNAFTLFVKKQLKSWKIEGSDSSSVFAEQVDALKFSSFINWSLDDKNLIIYFDQYAIGPGVLGPVAFPLPIEAIKNFLQ